MLSDLIYCSIYFDFKEQDFFNIYRTLFDRGIAGWWQLLFPEVVKETFLSHHSGVTLAVTLPPLQTVPAGNKVPSQWVAPVTHGCPSWLAAHPTLTVREKGSLPAQFWVSHSSGGGSVTARAAPGWSDRKGPLTQCC